MPHLTEVNNGLVNIMIGPHLVGVQIHKSGIDQTFHDKYMLWRSRQSKTFPEKSRNIIPEKTTGREMTSPRKPTDDSLDGDPGAGAVAGGSSGGINSLSKRSGLDPLFVYGVKPEVRGRIFFGSDSTSLIYAAGSGVAKYNTKVVTQK